MQASLFIEGALSAVPQPPEVWWMHTLVQGVKAIHAYFNPPVQIPAFRDLGPAPQFPGYPIIQDIHTGDLYVFGF